MKTLRDDDADPGTREAELALALTGTTFNWVDNLTNLRAMAHGTTAPVVVVEGYGTAGDGGGGIFLWNATSTLADNDGTIVGPNDVQAASPGRWIKGTKTLACDCLYRRTAARTMLAQPG